MVDGFERNRISAGISLTLLASWALTLRMLYRPDLRLVSFQIQTNSPRLCALRASRSRGLSTYLFRIRCQVSTNYGTSRWVALCAYLQLFKPRTLMFSKAFAKWSIKQHNNTFRPRAWIFPLRLELLQECASLSCQLLTLLGAAPKPAPAAIY